jgi:hypothetical protein
MKTRTVLLSVACVTVTCLPFLVSSADNPAQAKAREALRASEAPAAPKPAAPEPAPVAQPAAAAAAKPAPAKPAPVAATPVTNGSKPGYVAGPPAPDNEAQARARAAVRADMVAAQDRAAGYTLAPAQTELAAATRPDNEAQAKARAVVRDESPMLTSTGETASPAQVAPTQATPDKASTPTALPTTTTSARPNPLTAGMTPPESPFSPEQQAQLARLLSPYMADQMSTEEYHQKRAAIVAGS